MADANHFDIDRKFDRVVSVEMFEHLRNYETIFERIVWLLALAVALPTPRRRPWRGSGRISAALVACAVPWLLTQHAWPAVVLASAAWCLRRPRPWAGAPLPGLVAAVVGSLAA